MPGSNLCRTKTEKAVAVFVIVLIISAIAVPIYISTLDNTGKDVTNNYIATTTKSAPYVSEGKLTFADRHFHLNGTSIRIVSGAIHYFRTVPERWRDRLLKLKACGMNTVETEGSLKFENREFILGGKPFRLLAGAFHYFRVLPEYWTDRLLKIKACGLNTVETYVPWNLHEENESQYNFEGILDLRKFIQLAHKLGLYVIFRPGPYICSEWDFGGLPGWLLSDPEMKVRSNYPGYTKAVEKYFDKLLPLVVDLQYSNGGPIIAFQIENEFGSYDSDIQHLLYLKQLYIQHGFKELFLTSDNIWGVKNDPFYQHALPTANFKEIGEGQQIFDLIKSWGTDFPLMVTEFWTGWFDHWDSEHEGLPVDEYEGYLRKILEANASVNFYMFHGGTNFGFMNGANKENQKYKPDVSNYDYDALLSEKGDITPKYLKTRELLQEYIYNPLGVTLPEVPHNTSVSAYGPITPAEYVPFEVVLETTQNLTSPEAVPMEMLKLPGDRGQNFGYVLYRAEIPGNAMKLSFENIPTDRAQIYVDSVQVGSLDWKSENTNITLPSNTSQSKCQVDILVENHGRVNYATLESGTLNTERKGIHGKVYVDEKPLDNFTIYPLEFKTDAVNRSDWQSLPAKPSVPALFKAALDIAADVADSFVYMKGWGKGIVFVNGFNLGRYWCVGPQQTLYVPGPKLHSGSNQIVVFEQEKVGESIVFTDTPIYDVNDVSKVSL